MGDFANGWKNQVVSILLSVVVIGINLYFVVSLVNGAGLSTGWIVLICK
jgi:natural resistance-associated macrophage protein 2